MTAPVTAPSSGLRFERQELGAPIARGSRSVIHAWGDHAVAKVPMDTTPEGWIRFEATYTEAVYASGAPVPRVLGVEMIGGRAVSIFERIDGQSMWDALMANPADATRFGCELAELHLSVLELTPPIIVPSQQARLDCKIRTAARTVHPLAKAALSLLPEHRGRVALCHGDFHPKNVILSSRGPVVVDWFDVSRGDPCADVARTSLLLTGGENPDAASVHLPGASRPVLNDLHDAYLQSMTATLSLDPADLSTWRFVEAAARLSEGVPAEPLLALLRGLPG
jgi:aminoglycoside phosphotransferase (APT) family kinase protein